MLPEQLEELQVEPVDVPEKQKCPGCGVELQMEDDRKLGYVVPERFSPTVPEEVATDDILKSILDYTPKSRTYCTLIVLTPSAELSRHSPVCQRCWQLKQYGRVIPVEVTHEFLLQAIKPLKNKKALMVKIVDIIDFDGSFLPDFKKFVGGLYSPCCS